MGGKIKKFTNAVHKYREIYDDKDLKRNHLTLAEYDMIYDMLSQMSKIDGTCTETTSSGVANWFRKMKFEVKEKGVGWEVSV